jgi:protein involved in polysaccharide export with SLBB domain
VDVYANLEASLPVSVFISGAVISPGRYEGTANDSIIDYIKKAGGIDLERGSFRDVRIKRYNKTLEIFDLYEFLQKGNLPEMALEDGDIILVTERGMQVSSEGEVMNEYKFEFKQDSIKGSEFKKYASVKPGATHAVISGNRDGKPIKKYLKSTELDEFNLLNGDEVVFEAGEHADKIKVTIKGLHNGSKTMVLPLDAKLSEVLNNVPVDKNISDIDSVYIKRKSVAVKQKDAIKDSVSRLQETLVLARASGSTDKSPVGEGEVRLLESIATKAELVEPEGKVVVKNKDGYSSALLLEDGDEIIIPQKTNLVMVNGEIIMPKAIMWEEGMSLSSYIEKAGGFSDNANEDDIIVVRANGETVLGNNVSLKPGDEIMVMPEIKLNNLELASKVAEILYKVAIAAAIPFRL